MRTTESVNTAVLKHSSGDDKEQDRPEQKINPCTQFANLFVFPYNILFHHKNPGGLPTRFLKPQNYLGKTQYTTLKATVAMALTTA